MTPASHATSRALPAPRARRRVITTLACAVALVAGLPGLSASATAADTYPSHPIRVIVPFAAGSGTDNGVRMSTQYVAQKQGWNLVVDNKPGGNGIIGVQDFLRAPADGYTLISTGNTTHAGNPVLFKQLPYDPITDFTPVHRSLIAPLALFVAPKHNVQDVQGLIALIRSQPPNTFTYAAGSASHRATAERFNQSLGLKTTHVPYKSSPQALTDLIGGHVDFMFVDTAAVLGQIQGGTLKPLAVTSPQRVEVLPNVPTMIEAGLPDFVMTGWSVIFARAGTPEPMVAALRTAFRDYSHSDVGQKYRRDIGALYEDQTPEQLQAFIQRELALYQEIYRKAGIQPE